MGKTLKVLTVFIFLFSVFAFVMGVMNYNKRELLIGRTTMLERYVTSLALTIETEQPEFEGAPSHTEWDLDEVTDRANDDPAMSDFWGSYSNALEVSGQSFVRLGTEKNRQKLATYYQTEMVEGKLRIKKDFQGRPVTEGPDTMHDLLEDTLDRAKAQLERLNATRAELIKMRNALNEVAGLLNEEKKLRRENLSTITQLRQKIEELENTIVEKDNQIARLEREKAELQDTIASLNPQIEEKDLFRAQGAVCGGAHAPVGSDHGNAGPPEDHGAGDDDPAPQGRDRQAHHPSSEGPRRVRHPGRRQPHARPRR